MDYCPITIGYCFLYCFLEIFLCGKTQGKDSYKYIESIQKICSYYIVHPLLYTCRPDECIGQKL